MKTALLLTGNSSEVSEVGQVILVREELSCDESWEVWTNGASGGNIEGLMSFKVTLLIRETDSFNLFDQVAAK